LNQSAVVQTDNLLIYQQARKAKKATSPGRLYNHCTNWEAASSPPTPKHRKVSVCRRYSDFPLPEVQGDLINLIGSRTFGLQSHEPQDFSRLHF